MLIGGVASWLSDALAPDFGDLGDLRPVVRLLVRVVVAAVLGGLLGWQREHTGKAAGLRTHMLVAMGAALFMAAAGEAGIGKDLLSRVIQGVVTGIGFVGGGVILKLTEQRQIKGLTTATSIWMAAAVGVAAGLGREASAVLGTLLAFFVLSVLGRVEGWLEGRPKGGPRHQSEGQGGAPPGSGALMPLLLRAAAGFGPGARLR